MPSVPERKNLSSEEFPEFLTTGPFGGIQSELPLTEIEQFGFSDIENFILREGFASVRPGWTALPAFPSSGEPYEAIADFFNSSGNHIQTVITPTRLLQYLNGAWNVITGPGFASAPPALFGWDVLNYKLCFSQGIDPLWIWDGESSSYVQAASNAPPGIHIAEIGNHLFVINPAFPQRYYWSGIGDPTDWSSFTSGLNDIVNNLGPINGINKLGQYGFGYHFQGIVQIIPTGIGTAPFDFQPIVNSQQSVAAPYSLAKMNDQGQDIALYLGIDNVYAFNGTSIEPIGDMPMGDGSRRRLGARTRILTDAKQLSNSQGGYNGIYGFCTYAINGNPYRAYWLVIPQIAVWVYNFDETNWTRFTYSNTIVTIGSFFRISAIRIEDLIGTIAAQTWTPANLQTNNPLGGFLLGCSNGTGQYVDFTNYCELPASITSGKIIFGDRRHKHTTKKYRLAVMDQGSSSYTIQITNERGFSESHTITLGTGSGDVLAYVQEFKVTGLRIQWQVSVSPALLPQLTEVATDNFTRANESPLNPVNWTIPLSYGLQIVNNQCVPINVVGLFGEIYTGSSLPNNMYVQVTVAQLQSQLVNPDNEIAISVRETNPQSLNGYLLQFGNNGDGTCFIVVYAYGIGGGPFVISIDSLGFQINPGDTMALAIVGNNLFVLHNGTVVAQATDVTYPTGSFAGLYMSGTGVAVSDFVCGSATTQSTPQPGAVVEFAPYYDTAGEQRGGTIDN